MNPRIPFLAAAAALVTLGITGCSNDYSTLQPARGSPDPVVFSDGFGDAVEFQAFLGTKLDAVQLVTDETYTGTSALAVSIPALSEPDGNFAGGAFTTAVVRDLTGYDALTLWAKASRPATLNTAGIANDNTGESLYEASTEQLVLTTSWQKYVIPIPLPAKLDLEGGLFFFAEGLEVGEDPYTIYFDEIRYERTGIVSNPRPFMPPGTLDSFVGATLDVAGTQTTLAVSGEDIQMNHLPNYFTFFSSDESVAAVTEGGQVKAVGGGSATITAKLGTVDVTGAITVAVAVPPDNAPPAPTVPPGDVISLISNNPSYQNVNVDRWSADFDQATVTDLTIAGAPIKAYTYEPAQYFCAIEFTSQTIDATSMTHLHLDVWLPEGEPLLVKLVDFGDDGIYNPPGTGGDDSESFVVFLDDPPILAGSWISLEIPLADFTQLIGRSALAQIILQRTGAFPAYFTNIYFHR